MSAQDELTPADEERLARYRASAMSAGERQAFERDTLASDALSEALYREEALDALGRDAPRRLDARPALAARRRTWGLVRAALPAAASLAALAAVLVWTQNRRLQDEDLVRGAVAVAQPVAPVGELVEPPREFSWSRDPGAESYRVDLFAPDGSRLATVVTSATSVPAAALSAAPVPAGAWRVVPLGADGLERPAAPRVEFHLHAP
jgi:hypothetical protein